jgi:hypothetical protein
MNYNKMKYLITVLSAVGILIVSIIICKLKDYNVLYSFVPFALTIIIGSLITIAKNKKENYHELASKFNLSPFQAVILAWAKATDPTLDDASKDNCVVCIAMNISKKYTSTQFLDLSKSPLVEQQKVLASMKNTCFGLCNKPASEPLQKINVLNWIMKLEPSMESKVESGCLDCVVDAMLEKYNLAEFTDLLKLSEEDQMKTLDSMKSGGCTNRCFQPHPLPPSPINRNAVLQWVSKIAPHLNPECAVCITNNVVKKWTFAQFMSVMGMDPEKQQDMLNSILVLDCHSDCIFPKLTAEQVEPWLKTVYKGRKENCYTCLTNAILKNWSTPKFDEVKALSPVSIKNILDAISSMNCPDCQALTVGAVEDWVSNNIIGDYGNCRSCIVKAIIENFDPMSFADLQKRNSLEISQIITALITMNCNHTCIRLD